MDIKIRHNDTYGNILYYVPITKDHVEIAIWLYNNSTNIEIEHIIIDLMLAGF